MIRPRSTRLASAACGAVCVALLAIAPNALGAASAPRIDGTWVSDVTATSANLRAEVNPGELSTSYFFEYITEAAYLANGETFTGAATAPSGGAFLGYGTEDLTAYAHISLLSPGTPFRYRVVATNSLETVDGPTRVFVTQTTSPGMLLADNRAWEMVSPVDKNGGSVQPVGENAGGGVLQAAERGGAVTYSSASSFGEAPIGAPPASQYLSRHVGGVWLTANITTPAISGSYGSEPRGVPYQLFSPDLATGLVLNGQPCRGEGSECPVDNPPLPGTEAPAGYQNYYLRNDESGTFTAILTHADSSDLTLPAERFEVHFVAASPDLRHVVVSTCAKLTPDATEVAGPSGCEPSATNLYLWSGGQLTLINANPGAVIAAQRGAVAENQPRVYFLEGEQLYVRDGAAVHLVAEGPELEFQTATPEGAAAFYIQEGHLYRYDLATEASTDLTPSGGVLGMLGASNDGSIAYYEDGNGIERFDGASTSPVAPLPEAAQPSDFLPGTAGGSGVGTTRVTGDGSELLFLSKKSEGLSEYDNTDAESRAACGMPNGICDSEVYLFDAGSGELICVSCNPSGSRPLGPATIPGAARNGTVMGSTEAYEPRDLSGNGRRVFFDSVDALLPPDTDHKPDVYEWEAKGEGSCTTSGGCLSLMSSGRGEDGASFLDASAEGTDVFILTDQSLVRRDPGSTDVYDARIGGVNTEPAEEELCLSDECAPLPAAPEEPTVGTLTPGPTNPPLTSGPRCPKSKREVVRHGKVMCIAKTKSGRGHHNAHRHNGHRHKPHNRPNHHRPNRLGRAG